MECAILIHSSKMPCEEELLSNYHYKSTHPGMRGVYAHTHMPELFISCWHGDFIGSKCLVAKQTGNKLQNYYLLLWSVCESEKERRKSNLCIAALYQALSQVPTDSVSLLVVLVFSIFSLENASCTRKHSCHGYGLSGLMARVSCLGLKSQLVPEVFPWLQFPSQSYETSQHSIRISS